MPTAAPAEMRAARRRARYGSRLARHLVWWCAAGRTPTAMAAVLFGARASVYRPVRAEREGSRAWASDDEGPRVPPVRRPMWLAPRRRAWVARLQAPPRASGGCRPRWRGATRALTWQATRGITVAADTRRRWLPAVDGVWTRPPRVATADEPRRVERWARLWVTCAPRQRAEAMVCADALAIPLWPKVGEAWRPQGRHLTVMTPGTTETRDLAGALAQATGARRHGVAARHTNALCRDRLTRLEAGDPAERYRRLAVVGDHSTSPHAKAVAQGLAAHPRLTRLGLPTSGPRAHPSARLWRGA